MSLSAGPAAAVEAGPAHDIVAKAAADIASGYGRFAEEASALKDGVLPAVKVDGSATIDFSYSPRVLRWLYPWLAALIAAIALMAVAGRQGGRRAKAGPGLRG